MSSTTTGAGLSGAHTTLAAVRAAGERAGATAVILDRPGSRLRPEVWQRMLTGVLAVSVTAVSVPLLATLYDIFVPLAFLLAAAHAAALVLALFRPGLAIGLSACTVVAVALLSLGATGLPALAWPLPVATLITQLLVCAFTALRGELRTALTALWVSVVAASVPLVVTLADGDLWATALPNLGTFHCVAVLVTAVGLGVSRAVPRVTVGV